MVKRQQAIVYHGGGRRWFTLKAACFAEAKAKIKTRCDCHPEDNFGPNATGYCCPYHKNWDRTLKLTRRLTRVYMAAYRAAAAIGKGM